MEEKTAVLSVDKKIAGTKTCYRCHRPEQNEESAGRIFTRWVSFL